jgi:GT2 family glycosyltransferase
MPPSGQAPTARPNTCHWEQPWPIAMTGAPRHASHDLNQKPTSPTISVVIPTRNRRQLLGEVLAALADQEGIAVSAMEAVVVVDGADDGTVAELEGYEPPFRVVVLEQVHSGVATARNRGWKQASSELVLFLDDDVIPDKHLVSQHLQAHRANPDGVVLGQVLQGPDGGEAWTWYDGWTMHRKYSALAAKELPSGIHFGGNFSLTRARLEEVDGFDHVLPRSEHVDLGYRLAQRGVEFRYAPDAVAVHVGRRDFNTWEMSYRLDGRMDVALYRDRGYAGGLPTILASYHDRHWLNRLLLRMAFAHRSAEKRLILGTSRIGSLAHRARLRPVVRLAFSATANIVYWGGVRDGLRGSRAFWRAISETRSHSARPYRLRGREA